jgi:ADP-heptose:LPS heptosyltransferase
VVCVHPAAGNEMKRWPAEYFAGLIDLLIEGDGVNVVLIGAAEDRAVANAVLDKIRNRDRVALAVGLVRLGELPGLLARCALFVGNDSGPKHIAAAVGVPTVGVHSGNVDLREWGPSGPRAVAVGRRVECSPCYLARPGECQRGLACLTSLRPSDVYAVCRRLLTLGHGAIADA